jgi:Dodecin
MSHHIYKHLELTGSSETSIEDAVHAQIVLGNFTNSQGLRLQLTCKPSLDVLVPIRIGTKVLDEKIDEAAYLGRQELPVGINRIDGQYV